MSLSAPRSSASPVFLSRSVVSTRALVLRRTVGSRVRSRDGWVFGCATVLGLVLVGRGFVVPLIPAEITMETDPFSGLPLALVLAMTATTTMPRTESGLPVARLRSARAITLFALGLLTVAVLATIVALGPILPGAVGQVDDLRLIRSAVLFLALGLGGAVVLGADLGWILPAVLAVATIFWGKNADQEVRPWAIVLQHGPVAGASVLVLTMLLAAMVSFVLWDGTGLLRRRELVG